MTATIPDLAARALRRLGVAAVDANERPPITALVPAATLATRALEWIGVIGSGEAATVSDMDVATAKVAAANEELVAAGLASWGVDAVPLAVSEEVVKLAAMHLGPTFGRPVGDPDARQRIEQRIRRALQVARAQTDAEQAVQDVHAALDAAGKTRWTVFDIPDYVEASYVVMAANLMAPQFGVAVDEAGQMRAERQLARAISLPASGEPLQQEYF